MGFRARRIFGREHETLIVKSVKMLRVHEKAKETPAGAWCRDESWVRYADGDVGIRRCAGRRGFGRNCTRRICNPARCGGIGHYIGPASKSIRGLDDVSEIRC